MGTYDGRTVIHSIVSVFTVLLISLGWSTAAQSSPPNLVFIFADDWGWGDLSCHGHPYIKTPHIDRLAREGTDFHRFTVASGVCSPSRTAMMTGHYPARYNINGHFAAVSSNAKRNMPDWLDPSAVTVPKLLRQAGYKTGHFGKWHLSNNMIPDSPTPAPYGYDEYAAFNCSGEQMPVHEDSRLAIEFMKATHQSGKPFFVNLWIHEPHTPFHTVPKYRWRFRDSGLEEADEIYASVLSHADDRIGDLLEALDRMGIADDTLVIFSSDNGPARANPSAELTLMRDSATGVGYGIAASKGVTGGRKGYKASLFEGGINVPFIARWPGKIAKGQVNDSLMISAVDLLPTLCEIAGAKLPEHYEPDGISQVAGLTGTPTGGRPRPLYWKMESRSASPKSQPFHWVSYVVVDQNWKLLASENAAHLELYDIVNDPLEQDDLLLSDRQAHWQIVSQMVESLNQWKATLPDHPEATTFSSLR